MGGMCGKKKVAEEEGSQGKTYQDYLDERGYKPLCLDNTGEDLWIIFCCLMWLYALVISYYALTLKAALQTVPTSAALWMFAFTFLTGACMVIFAVNAAAIARIPAPEDEVDAPPPAPKKELAALRWMLRGHTAKAGSPGASVEAQKLSQRRAEAVKAALVATGSKKDAFDTEGVGDKEIIDTRVPEKNMRVEFDLIYAASLKQTLDEVGYKDGAGFDNIGAGNISFNIQKKQIKTPPISFEPNSATLTPEGAAVVQAIGAVLNHLESAAQKHS